MGNIAKYSGVNTKVKALFGRLLNDEDYRHILQLDKVNDIFQYLLNNTHYYQYLNQLSDIGEIHRRQLERTLKKNFSNDFYDMRLFLHGKERQFFDHIFTRYEIEEVKMILRTILIEHDRKYLEKHLTYLDENSIIDMDVLANVNDYQSLLEIFEGTWYYDVLKRFEGRYETDKNLFVIETSLDLKYFDLLKEYSEKLSRSDRKTIWELIGPQMDLLNINWIYRIKKYYELGGEEIINYLIPQTYNIKKDDLRKMAYLEDHQKLLDYLSNTKYKSIFSSLSEEEDVLFEKKCRAYILEKAKKIKRRGSYNLGLVNSYLFIKEYEIQDIITIVESVRYSLEKNKIPRNLIRNNF